MIANYREKELRNDLDDANAQQVLVKLQMALREAFPDRQWLPPHVIDLKGRIDPHIDSVKFSGGIVAGLSLLATATMRLSKADPMSGDVLPQGDSYDLLLEPGSLYILTGPARFEYAHSIFDLSEDRRLSIIMRDLKIAI